MPSPAPSPAQKALQKMGLKSKIWFATFDLSEEIANGIKDGSVQFAIDQQPYLQGYIPVAILALSRQLKTNDVAVLQDHRAHARTQRQPADVH